MGPLFIILILDMHVQRFNIFRLSITPVLIEGQVVICELPLIFTHILYKGLVFSLQGKISSVIFVDILYLLFHLANLLDDLIILRLEKVNIISSIIDLAARSLILNLNA